MSDPLKLSECRVLVTGARGFIGSHLAQALVRQGAEVHCISRTQSELAGTGPRWWKGDLTDAPETGKVLRQIHPDIIYHLSSMPNGRRGLELVEPIFRAETVGTVNLLRAAAEALPRRVVLAGSMEEPLAGQPPLSPYAAAKAASRVFGQLFRALYSVPVVFTRIFMTYGPGQPDWKVIPYCIRTLLAGNAPRIASADREVDWLYVTDLIRGLLSLGEAPDPGGESVDLGSGTLVRLRHVVEQIEAILGAPHRAVFGDPPPGPLEEAHCADLGVATQLLGWRPLVSLEDGLRMTVEHIRQGGG